MDARTNTIETVLRLMFRIRPAPQHLNLGAGYFCALREVWYV